MFMAIFVTFNSNVVIIICQLNYKISMFSLGPILDLRNCLLYSCCRPTPPKKKKGKKKKKKKKRRERLFCETGKPLLNIILLKALLLFGYAGIASFCLKVSLKLRCVFGGTSYQAGSRFVFVRQFICLRHI